MLTYIGESPQTTSTDDYDGNMSSTAIVDLLVYPFLSCTGSLQLHV